MFRLVIESALESEGIARPAAAVRPNPELSTVERELLALQRQDTLNALRHKQRGEIQIEKLLTKIREFGSRRDLPEGTRIETIGLLAQRIAEIRKAFAEVKQSSPEAFLAANSSTVRAWRGQLSCGRIVQTPFVQEKITEIVTSLGRGKVTFMHGETGTGKTEVSRVAAKLFAGKEPIVVRGYSGMDSTELFGHMTLSADRQKTVEGVVNLVQDRLAALRAVNPGATSEDQIDLTKNILAQSGVTISEYILGAVYKCAQEGRVLILDEANYIPPTLLAKMNDIFTKRPGESINVQEDGIGPISVKPGWGIILTGNVNVDPRDKRYLGRHEFDLALRDRLSIIDYNYLPQATDGKPAEHPPEQKQLFQVAVTALLAPYRRGGMPPDVRILESIENRQGSMYLPGGEAGLDTLWRFCQFAAVTQRAFAGEIKDGSPYGFARNGVSAGYRPDIALSPRVLMGVLEDWRAEGFGTKLDSYLAKALIQRALKGSDQAYFFQLGQMFGFFSGPEWNGVQTALEKGNRPNLPSAILETASVDFVPGRQVLTAMFAEPPTRTVWPDGGRTEAQVDQSAAARLIELQAAFAASADSAAAALELYKDITKTP